MRSDLERLKDIEEAILKIEKYSVKGKLAFIEDELIQTWILFHLQNIGEAVRAMSQEFINHYDQVNWIDIIDFRNLLVHEYFRIDLEIVWLIVQGEIPTLKSQIKHILENIQ